ncbi:protein RADIALIS-like 4 [Ziziphus jujuba]|uniref:Protein RADIALIS-like 4 n=1 Tax=Ziziphus jujuba TaxID=326968 RepID=A0A6P6GI65_ZIZJJ|nr:protein RADIALIS-like 4 [Ziziphus jujuba]
MDTNDFPKVLCGWSWEENKQFELALAVVDEQDPDRWQEVAAKIGGQKSAEDVQKHYVILLEDLQVIESGQLDHKLGLGLGLGEAHNNYVQLDCIQSAVCWTNEDNDLLVQLDLN